MTRLNPARVSREFPSRYRLQGARCTACGEVCYPARRVCPECRSRSFEPCRINDTGEILTFTVIRVAGPGFSHDVPYVLAVIGLEGGGRITCQVVDMVEREAEIGMKVRLEFRRIQEDGEAGVIAYGHKAVPA